MTHDTWWIAVVTLGIAACAGTGTGGATQGPPAPPVAEVTGTVTYLERVALPPNAVVRVELRDVSRADVASGLLASQEITPVTQVPIPFTLRYDPSRIDERMTYAVSARIEVDGRLAWISDTRHPVLTRGAPSTVEVRVTRVPR